MKKLFKERADHWGIRAAVKEIYNDFGKGHYAFHNDRKLTKEYGFDIFFFQYIPDIWKSSRESVLRHKSDICNLLNGYYSDRTVWIKRNNQLKGTPMKPELLIDETITFPEYSEIEHEKTKWQNKPGYVYKEHTEALEEEYVQLRFIKK